MSTSVRRLTPMQILFVRPAIAFGILSILAMIVAKPFYNLVAVLFAIVLYGILYQNRKYIYSMGLSRFDFFVFLFYGSFLLSAFFNWTYKHDDVLVGSITKVDLWALLSDTNYQKVVYDWFVANLDGIIHWKMILFSPAIAIVLYLIFVEFDRKSVKAADLQHLGLTDNDLFGEKSIVGTLGSFVFVIAAGVYGMQYCLAAMFTIIVINAVQIRTFVILAIIFTLAILFLNYAHFKYIIFLSLPTQVTSLIHSNGIWNALKQAVRFENIGQWYILVPYFVIMGLMAWSQIRNRERVQVVQSLQAHEREAATIADALQFGYDMNRKAVMLTHKELNTHMYINGASGSGKTVAMLNFVIEAAQKKIPLIYIDGKGATDLEEKISKIAAQYGRVFKIFTLSPDAVPETSPYDFLGAGTFTEKKNRIMQLFIQADAAGAAYFQDNLETFINRVFMVINQHGFRMDLFRFISLIININELIEFAKTDIVLDDGSRINLKSYFEEVRDMKRDQSPRHRIITKLDPFIHSSYGSLFNVIDKPNVINLKQSIKNGEIVLFLFDASSFALDTERVAKMVISDINATFAEFGKEKNPIKTFCCFDEFKSYQTDAISKTISLHRSNGMHAIIGTQSLSVIDREIGNGILTNCQTHLVMASSDEDAERFAEEFGKRNKAEYSVRTGTMPGHDVTTKFVMDYQINKQDIKEIVVYSGQGYLHRKAIGAKAKKIQVEQKV